MYEYYHEKTMYLEQEFFLKCLSVCMYGKELICTFSRTIRKYCINIKIGENPPTNGTKSESNKWRNKLNYRKVFLKVILLLIFERGIVRVLIFSLKTLTFKRTWKLYPELKVCVTSIPLWNALEDILLDWTFRVRIVKGLFHFCHENNYTRKLFIGTRILAIYPSSHYQVQWKYYLINKVTKPPSISNKSSLLLN
jgi:hypothetical protein